MTKSVRFAGRLADALALMLPGDLSVAASSGQLVISGPTVAAVLPVAEHYDGLVELGETPHEAARLAALAVLNDIQDTLSEALTIPWPPVKHALGHQFAKPHAAISGGWLSLWFGDDRDATEIPEVRVELP